MSDLSFLSLSLCLQRNQSLRHVLTTKSNREYLLLAKKCRLIHHLEDFRQRLTDSAIDPSLKEHYSSAAIIYPCGGHHQSLTDHLSLIRVVPLESILPLLSRATHGSSQLREQLRSKCYFVPFTKCQMKSKDERRPNEGVQPALDIAFETAGEEPCSFVSDEFSHQGFIRCDQEAMPQEFAPFVHVCPETSIAYLSSSLLQQWLNTFLLINQTCAIAKRFLKSNGNHMTFLIKEQSKDHR